MRPCCDVQIHARHGKRLRGCQGNNGRCHLGKPIQFATKGCGWNTILKSLARASQQRRRSHCPISRGIVPARAARAWPSRTLDRKQPLLGSIRGSFKGIYKGSIRVPLKGSRRVPKGWFILLFFFCVFVVFVRFLGFCQGKHYFLAGSLSFP